MRITGELKESQTWGRNLEPDGDAVIGNVFTRYHCVVDDDRTVCDYPNDVD